MCENMELLYLCLCRQVRPQEYNSPRFRRCDEECAPGIVILLNIDKGVPVTHRPTKLSPFGWALVDCHRALIIQPLAWSGLGQSSSEQASQTLVFSIYAHSQKCALPVHLKELKHQQSGLLWSPKPLCASTCDTETRKIFLLQSSCKAGGK